MCTQGLHHPGTRALYGQALSMTACMLLLLATLQQRRTCFESVKHEMRARQKRPARRCVTKELTAKRVQRCLRVEPAAVL
jgi:heme exporter protein D